MTYNNQKSRFELNSGRYISVISSRMFINESLDLCTTSEHEVIEYTDINYLPTPSWNELDGNTRQEKHQALARWVEINRNEFPLTEDERSEIADYYIDLWNQYKKLQ